MRKRTWLVCCLVLGWLPAAWAAKPAAEIRIAHDLPPEAEALVTQWAHDFNAQQKQWRVKPVAIDALYSAHAVIAPDTFEQMKPGPRLRSLSDVMRTVDRKWNESPELAVSDALFDRRGRIDALPLAVTTPVTYINEAAFAQAGQKPEVPATWRALQDTLGKLVDSGHACAYTSASPSWVHITNLSARHDAPVAVSERRQPDRLAINGLVQVKHLALMASWHKAEYLKLFGPGDEAVDRFARGECAVLTADASVYPALQQRAGFKIGVAPLPYYEDIPGAPFRTLLRGDALWVIEGRARRDYAGVAQFIQHVLKPSVQQRWAEATGYLPLNSRGQPDVSVMGEKASRALSVAYSEASRKAAPSIRQAPSLVQHPQVAKVMDEELGHLWAGRKPALELLESAVRRVRTDEPPGPWAAAPARVN